MDELTGVLHRDIPIARAMGVTVLQADPGCVLLTAPLAPNINHMGTLFGGSANSLAILAAWSLLTLRTENIEASCHIIIQRNRMHYRQPIIGEVTARCVFHDTRRWERFLHTLQRHGRDRVTLYAEVFANYQQKSVGSSSRCLRHRMYFKGRTEENGILEYEVKAAR